MKLGRDAIPAGFATSRKALQDLRGQKRVAARGGKEFLLVVADPVPQTIVGDVGDRAAGQRDEGYVLDLDHVGGTDADTIGG